MQTWAAGNSQSLVRRAARARRPRGGSLRLFEHVDVLAPVHAIDGADLHVTVGDPDAN